MKKKVWEVLDESNKNIIDILLTNRGLTSKTEKDDFFNPKHPSKLTLLELGIDKGEINKAKKRIKSAKENKEEVIVYGDYDADGVTSTAVMWEALHKFGLSVMPYIPDRFLEGYGIKAKSVENLKSQNPNLKLIVTVDNGIVASDEIKKINKMGIDVIITDHHVPSIKHGKPLFPEAYAIIHTTQIAGSAVSWILTREIEVNDGLELVAIGTIADQVPLIGANRSFAKYGLEELGKTKRAGILELAKEAGIKLEGVGMYEINYIIAPRLNSMGRLMHAIDSLRLLCTKDRLRAKELAKLVSKTNLERQSIVDEVILSVRKEAKNFSDGIIFISGENYHEGVIGLAAGRLVEEFYRPAIVVSVGKELSKGSARSINGLNIIELIRKEEKMLEAHGGHTMAAGFTIKTSKLDKFYKRINKSAKGILSEEMLNRKLKIDCEIKLDSINWELSKRLKEFEPNGLGNPQPTFLTRGVEVIDARLLGKDKKHLKLKLRKKNKFIDAIGFGLGEDFGDLERGENIDLVYGIDENEWNGTKSLQLKIKDLKVS